MRIVYRTEDSRLGGFVALKFLPQVAHSDSVAIERFRREARAASAVIAGEITIRHRQPERSSKNRFFYWEKWRPATRLTEDS
jgi:hypothetical protein